MQRICRRIGSLSRADAAVKEMQLRLIDFIGSTVESKADSLPEHLERYLGRIANGWSDESSPYSIQVACFDNQPQQGITTYVTVGMSDVVLKLKNGRSIRQELVISVNATVPSNDVASFLIYYAEKVSRQDHAILRGEVRNMLHPLIEGATVEALYATNPAPFDEKFSELNSVDPHIIFVLLIPITENEVHLIDKWGWNWFEDALEEQDLDIWDLTRKHELKR